MAKGEPPPKPSLRAHFYRPAGLFPSREASECAEDALAFVVDQIDNVPELAAGRDIPKAELRERILEIAHKYYAQKRNDSVPAIDQFRAPIAKSRRQAQRLIQEIESYDEFLSEKVAASMYRRAGLNLYRSPPGRFDKGFIDLLSDFVSACEILEQIKTPPGNRENKAIKLTAGDLIALWERLSLKPFTKNFDYAGSSPTYASFGSDFVCRALSIIDSTLEFSEINYALKNARVNE